MKTTRAVLKQAFIAGTKKGKDNIMQEREIVFSLYKKRGHDLGNKLQDWLKAGETDKNR
jgi:hypothetical protein